MEPIHRIVLAALLHDIGKFMQRAHSNEDTLSQRSRNMESSICPEYDGKHRPRHVLWTNEFFEQYVPAALKGEGFDSTTNLASYHHRPETPLQYLIKEADRLSAGVDRTPKDYEDELGGGACKKERMRPIFESINLGQNSVPSFEYRYEIGQMDFATDSVFPKHKKELSPPEGESIEAAYHELWKDWVAQFQGLAASRLAAHHDHFLHALTSLLERFTWSIPSSTVNSLDISLYDHCYTTAAIAAALYRYHSETESLSLDAINDRRRKKFLLIGGDLSGIQKYIFSLAESNVKKVSKLLRARSFYLSLISEVSVHKILHALNLPLCCSIINAGGRFVLLAPNTKAAKEKLVDAYREMNLWYRKKFQGLLTFNLTWATELSSEDFRRHEFGRAVDQLARDLEEKKTHKFSEILSTPAGWTGSLFVMDENYDQYGSGVCQLCGTFPGNVESDRNFRVCIHCNEQIRLGKELTKDRLLFAYSHRTKVQEEAVKLFDGEYALRLLTDDIGDDLGANYLVQQLNAADHAPSFYPIKHMANHIPIVREKDMERAREAEKEDEDAEEYLTVGDPKTFNFLSRCNQRKVNDKWQGRPLLGVLKADVDRLGMIFSEGLGESMSISHYSTLSRQMNLFFTAFVQNLLHSKEDFGNIYTVYSGGDDMFLVGPWETMIGFSQTLNREFERYTCTNRDITISCGLAMIPPRFPINRGAVLAEENLDHSKNSGRDRLNLFLTTICWEELPELVRFKELLCHKIEERSINRSFVHRLLQYHQMYMGMAEEGKVQNARYCALMSYDIGRNVIERDRNDRTIITENLDLYNELQKLYDMEEDMDKTLMAKLKIPLFWTLYKYRGGR